MYSYTIFDSDPTVSEGFAWPSHENVEFEADTEERAVAQVKETLEIEASGLNPADGYETGQCLYALVWDDEGRVTAQVEYEITDDDLS